MNVVWRALRAVSVTSAQDSVHVSLVPLASVAMVARVGTGAFQTAGRVSVMVKQKSAIREPEPASTAEATRQETSVNGGSQKADILLFILIFLQDVLQRFYSFLNLLNTSVSLKKMAEKR